jgi:hypothetical protein
MDNSSVLDNIAESEGGGIFNNNKFRITNSTISGNQANLDAGGVRNRGSDTLTVLNSTISENQSDRVSGLLNGDFSIAQIQNSTVFGNQSGSMGAGIWNEHDATVLLYSTVIALNEEEGGMTWDIVDLAEFGSGVLSSGYNFIGNGDARNDVNGSKFFERLQSDVVGSSIIPGDPLLGSLAENGGVNPTHSPLAGSPVIDKGDCQMTGLAFDQRGATRVLDIPGAEFPNAADGCDIGSVEATVSVATPVDEFERALQEPGLEPAYPNPFAHRASFKLVLAREQNVTITLHNVAGQRVRTLHTGPLLGNTAYLFGIDGAGLASGLYYYPISGADYSASHPLLFRK